MRHLVILFTLFLLAARPALAVELGTLVSCATSVFNEIHRTHAWSGKAPADCPARVMVDKYTDGAVVTVWSWSGPPGAAVRTTYSVLMRYPELADAKALVTANRDVKARGRRLERCLNSLITVNDPLDSATRPRKSTPSAKRRGPNDGG
jgi:hypothetical protein